MKEKLDYLHLTEIGIFELCFALYPIISAYSIHGVPMYLAMLLVLDAFALMRKRMIAKELLWPVALMLAFLVIHDVLLIFAVDAPMAAINSLIGTIITLGSLIIIAPALDWKKFRGSLNWVAILSLLGIFYHFSEFYQGYAVSPLTLPFFDSISDDSRVLEEAFRPRSFFAEPQAYATFMMIPLIMAFNERKFLWAGIIIFSVLLSTSTTGFAFTLIIVGTYILTQQVGIGYKILVVIIALLLLNLFFNLDFFSYSLNKVENTTAENDIRLYQGRMMVLHMDPSYWVIGMPFLNPYQFFKSGELTGLDITVYEGNMIFVPTFWLMIMRFGVIGLLIYLNIYYRMFRYARHLWPWALCLIAGLFSNPDSVGGTFTFCMCFAYIFGNVAHLHNMLGCTHIRIKKTQLQKRIQLAQTNYKRKKRVRE